MVTVFAKIGDNEPDMFELEENSTCEDLIACVATKNDIDPENITITVDGKIINKDVVISSLDLGSILYFTVIVGRPNDEYLDEMFDKQQQLQIEEQIRREQIEHNLQYAYENTPEAFIKFSLLWVNVEINGVKSLALIDTGAQSSIIPYDIAKACHVDYLIDQRFQTLTMGVGAQVSKGRIHALNVKVGNHVWTNSFMVLTGTINHMILGIDWMTKNRAVLDLAQRCIILQGEKIPFIERDDSQ